MGYVMKSIKMISKSPIKIDSEKMISLVNEMRAKFGEKKSHKKPILLKEFLESCNVMQNRDEKNGMISLSIHYIDDNDIPCARNFPNFGLEVNSNSNLSLTNDEVILNIDFTVKAGSQKWQKNEISECAQILAGKECKVRLIITLDETTEWAGHSSIIDLKEFNDATISVDNFDILAK